MARQAGVTSRAPQPVGPYSQSTRIGRLVHAAGQGADDPATGKLAGPDYVGLPGELRVEFDALAVVPD